MTGAAPVWRIGGAPALRLEAPLVMGVINVTPDSFHAASRAPAPDEAMAVARRMVQEGAGMLDIGAESTRPGARSVAPDEQIARLIPVVGALVEARLGAPISVDTTSAAVARAALEAGASVINDVSAGAEDPELLDIVAGAGAGLVLMHRLAPPQQDSYSDQYQRPPAYADVIGEVRTALGAALAAAVARGVAAESVVLDPGLGFGKTVEQNLVLLARAGRCSVGARPVLIGASRKSFVGRAALGAPSEPGQRLAGSLAAAALGVSGGAMIVRTHDVGPTAEAVRLAWAALRASGNLAG